MRAGQVNALTLDAQPQGGSADTRMTKRFYFSATGQATRQDKERPQCDLKIGEESSSVEQCKGFDGVGQCTNQMWSVQMEIRVSRRSLKSIRYLTLCKNHFSFSRTKDPGFAA